MIKKISACINNGVTDEILIMFYNILLRWEVYGKTISCIEFDDKGFEKWCNENMLSFPHNTKKKTLTISDFSNEGTIQFISIRGLNLPQSLLKRLRNSFAHNLLEVKDGIIHFQDYYYGKFLMDGKLSYKLLKDLINYLIKDEDKKIP